MSAKLSGENRLSKEYAVKCWMKMYVCRRDKASITVISLEDTIAEQCASADVL